MWRIWPVALTFLLLPGAGILDEDGSHVVHRSGIASLPASDGFAAFAAEVTASIDEGGNWTSMVSGLTPSARSMHAMAYASSSDVIVLFGGYIGPPIYSDETWIYDLNANAWKEKSQSIKPSARGWHSLATDSESDRVILFGGSLMGASKSDETWAYDVELNAWTEMNANPSPSAMSRHAMAYDSESDRVMLFGGSLSGGHKSNETWSYDLNTNTWTEMRPDLAPPPRELHAMAYDVESDRVVLYGGMYGSSTFGDTWTYNFNTNTWTEMDAGTAPPRLGGHDMSYDARKDRAVLFGGLTEQGGQHYRLNETWSYDVNTNTWTRMNPATAPSARNHHRMAYDSESDRIVLFGGYLSPDITSDTWAYEHPPVPPSAPRDLHARAGDGEVYLSWEAPTSEGGSPVTDYRIYRGTISGELIRHVEIGKALSYVDVGLTYDVTYYYQISALNSLGEGPRSEEMSATPSDMTSPSIAISSPAEGDILASLVVTVNGTASDNVAIEKVEVSKDGVDWVLATGTSSWSVALSLSEGTNTLHARAIDTSGNIATVSVNVTVEVPLSGIGGVTWPLFAGLTSAVAAAIAIVIIIILRGRGLRGPRP